MSQKISNAPLINIITEYIESSEIRLKDDSIYTKLVDSFDSHLSAGTSDRFVQPIISRKIEVLDLPISSHSTRGEHSKEFEALDLIPPPSKMGKKVEILSRELRSRNEGYLTQVKGAMKGDLEKLRDEAEHIQIEKGKILIRFYQRMTGGDPDYLPAPPSALLKRADEIRSLMKQDPDDFVEPVRSLIGLIGHSIYEKDFFPKEVCLIQQLRPSEMGAILLQAARGGHFDTIEAIIQDPRFVWIEPIIVGSALRLAAENGHLHSLKFLFTNVWHRLSVDVLNSALIDSVKNGHSLCVEFILSQYLQPPYPYQPHWDVLREAAKGAVKRGDLLSLIPILKMDRKYGWGGWKEALVAAVAEGRLDCIAYIIRHYKGCYRGHSAGSCALEAAVEQGQLPSLELFLQLSLDQNYNYGWECALIRAIEEDRLDCVSFMLKKAGRFISDKSLSEIMRFFPYLERISPRCGQLINREIRKRKAIICLKTLAVVGVGAAIAYKWGPRSISEAKNRVQNYVNSVVSVAQKFWNRIPSFLR